MNAIGGATDWSIPDTLRKWTELRDLDVAMVSEWRQYWSGVISEPKSKPHDRVGRWSAQQHARVSKIESRARHTSANLLEPHVFIITDCMGVVLQIIGTDRVIESMAIDGMTCGVPFDVYHAGINAISFAMFVGTTAIVQGKEHSLAAFSSWVCACRPIFVQGQNKVIGYLDVSLQYPSSPALMASLLDYVMKDERRGLSASLSAYSLTARETEIAFYWLDHATVGDISEKLHISENTVLQFIANIYRKVSVSSKEDLFLKFRT